MTTTPLARLGVVAIFAATLAACTAPGGPDRITTGFFTTPDAAAPPFVDGGIAVETAPLVCRPTKSSEMMPARATITTGAVVAPTQPQYFTADLFNLFKSVCGGCHVESSLGNFSVSASNFTTVVDEHVLADIMSDDPAVFMPPAAGGGVPFSQRSATDAVVQLEKLLKIWLGEKRPSGVFNLPAPDSTQTALGYTLTPDLGAALSNIGSCVPDKGMIAKDPTDMDTLDTMFAAATATSLPPTLDKTDLTTLDSEALAKTGVVSYAPTYPLWTDNAGKMRYVRVPRGKSITFDKTSQTFSIPPNTRFYKTFLKQVVDATGTASFRKIETRMIVSRADVNLPDGTAQQTALYGTYLWNADESQATLLTDPLRDGKPFADRIFTYITDEQKAQPILDSKPANLSVALDQAGVTRHYAVPGGERCVQCHMGSPSQSFILGFTPLQVARRPTGTSGVYEPAMGEELTQLDRLISYGVITGLTPDDILPLEKSEGTRTPRTPQELNAQAYMVGNCAHCHNARGLPSVKQPALKDLLVFLPGVGDHQGIFQFPLDTVSPIRKRGLYQEIDIAYITPSLYDLPRDSAVAKWFCPAELDGVCDYTATLTSNPPPGVDPPDPPKREWVLAPWRSLVYRNVDTPYDYFDDSAVFPHMPLNSPGYDCRVAQLMGDWMVSIPAVIKDPTKPEEASPGLDNVFGTKVNLDPQPYREVKRGDDGYDDAIAVAKARLDQYHKSYRYNFCPSSYTDDIIDPTIQEAADKNLPIQQDLSEFKDPTDPTRIIMPFLAPIRPHYVSFDDTDPAGEWFPRRPDWADALVTPNIPTFIAASTLSDALTPDQVEDLTNVITALQTVSLTPETRTELLTAVPFGLWDTSKPGCDFSSQRTAGSFKGADRPSWMEVAKAADTAPVFAQSPGAAVFTSICFNCHGLNADSKGLLAEEISTLTGGDARVADFRDGLFGPVTAPGSNRSNVFSPAATTLGGGLTADDLGARYLAWMALGGTSKHIPTDVLTQVSETPVLGVLRNNLTPQGTPDMLRLGLQICAQVATSDPAIGTVNLLPLSELIGEGHFSWSQHSALIDANGDSEMWLRFCSLNNRPIVRVPLVNNPIKPGRWSSTVGAGDLTINGYNLYWGDTYGANPVMDRNGALHTGLTGVDFPICIDKPTDATEVTIAQTWMQANKIGGVAIPFCPDGLITPDHKLQFAGSGDAVDFTDARKWAARGAINAALAVFLYLDEIERDPTKRQPLASQCDLIGKQ
jgi:mono/diheme cytochrome c family protein